jgi:hypothetical protein
LWAGGTLAAGGAAGIGYGWWEAGALRVQRATVPVRHLPTEWVGTTVAVLGDLHYGPLISLDYIRRAVALANSLQPDLVALVGDFCHRGTKTDVELPPCLEVLQTLHAPLGVYAVPGNHDMQARGQVYRELIAASTLTDVTNRHVRVERQGAPLFLAGVDDLWWGRPDVRAALRGVPDRAAVLLLCHNPDYLEDDPDARVSLALSGHTHGGQIVLPGYGCNWVPSKYGNKYRHGLVQAPASPVFITCGVGTASIPLRVGVPPEVNLLTLEPA